LWSRHDPYCQSDCGWLRPARDHRLRTTRAYAAKGIFGQSIYINPAAHVVIVVWSAQQKPTGSAVIDDWAFFDAVVDALR
jgi:CubicO group peptidase (beta-lactamase class C family)